MVRSFKIDLFQTSSLSFIAKILQFCVIILIARFFGTSSEVDFYFFLFALINIINAIYTSFNHTVLIPKAFYIKEKKGKVSAEQFLNVFSYFFIIINILISVLIFLFPTQFMISFSQFETPIINENINIVYAFVPILLLGLLVNIYSDLLIYNKKYLAPILVNLCSSIFIIVFIFSFHKYFGILSVIYAISISHIFCFLFFIFYFMKYMSWNFNINPKMIDKKLYTDLFYTFLSCISTFFSSLAPTFIFSGFSSGSVSAFNYANNIANIPNSLVTNQICTISGIKFNSLAAKDNLNELNALFVKILKITTFILIPIGFISFLISDDLINLIYYFSDLKSSALSEISFIFKFLIISIVYFAFNGLSTRVFVALQKIKFSFWFGMFMNLINLTLLFLLSFYYGIIGFLIARIIYHLIVIISLKFLIYKYFNFVTYPKNLEHLFKIIILNSFILISLIIIRFDLNNILLNIIFNSSFYIISLLVSNYILRINTDINNELNHFFNKFKFHIK